MPQYIIFKEFLCQSLPILHKGLFRMDDSNFDRWVLPIVESLCRTSSDTELYNEWCEFEGTYKRNQDKRTQSRTEEAQIQMLSRELFTFIEEHDIRWVAIKLQVVDAIMIHISNTLARDEKIMQYRELTSDEKRTGDELSMLLARLGDFIADMNPANQWRNN